MDFIFIMLSDMTWLLPTNACMHCRASLSQSLTHVCYMTLHASSGFFSAVEGGGGADGYLS